MKVVNGDERRGGGQGAKRQREVRYSHDFCLLKTRLLGHIRYKIQITKIDPYVRNDFDL